MPIYNFISRIWGLFLLTREEEVYDEEGIFGGRIGPGVHT